jgi:hypothetical protein
VSDARRRPNAAFAWHTAATLLLMFDYFAFSTGNPSLIYSVPFGWVAVPLGLLLVFLSYTLSTVRRARRYFSAYLAIVVVASLILLSCSQLARLHAIRVLALDVQAFVDAPFDPTVDATPSDRQLMTEIRNHPFVVDYDGLTPVDRRIDYVIRVDQREYRLILRESWKGTPEVWLAPNPGGRQWNPMSP